MYVWWHPTDIQMNIQYITQGTTKEFLIRWKIQKMWFPHLVCEVMQTFQPPLSPAWLDLEFKVQAHSHPCFDCRLFLMKGSFKKNTTTTKTVVCFNGFQLRICELFKAGNNLSCFLQLLWGFFFLLLALLINRELGSSFHFLDREISQNDALETIESNVFSHLPKLHEM